MFEGFWNTTTSKQGFDIQVLNNALGNAKISIIMGQEFLHEPENKQKVYKQTADFKSKQIRLFSYTKLSWFV